MKRVTLFTMPQCPHCQTAKQFLDKQGIKYRLVDIKTPAGQKEFAKTRLRAVPVLKVGDQLLNGFSVRGFRDLYNN